MQEKLEKISSAVDVVVAASAVTISWWREDLHTVAGVAGDLAVILGVFWLVLRIAWLILHWNKVRKID
jgi:hypothetical protein